MEEQRRIILFQFQIRTNKEFKEDVKKLAKLENTNLSQLVYSLLKKDLVEKGIRKEGDFIT